ncbi:MAG: hypothetical protein ACYTG2_04210 [Planctomycetota bacterium]|jgi:hypothetical protein
MATLCSLIVAPFLACGPETMSSSETMGAGTLARSNTCFVLSASSQDRSVEAAVREALEAAFLAKGISPRDPASADADQCVSVRLSTTPGAESPEVDGKGTPPNRRLRLELYEPDGTHVRTIEIWSSNMRHEEWLALITEDIQEAFESL